MERKELLEIIEDKIDDIFLAYQQAEGIKDGGIDPFLSLELEDLQEKLCDLVIDSMKDKVMPNFLPVEQWQLTSGNFPGFSDKMISIEPCDEYEDIEDSKTWELQALVKVGEWGGHEIHRHLWCTLNIKNDYADFHYDDEYFFDFENLNGDDEKFEELEDILSSVWTKEFDKAIEYTNDHMYRAVELMLEQLGKENPLMKETIDSMSERGRVGYDHRPDLFYPELLENVEEEEAGR